MEFDTEHEAYGFYNIYGDRLGFSIQKEYFNNSRKTGKFLMRLFTCCKEGAGKNDRKDIHTKIPRSETIIGWGARMHIKYNELNGKYLVDNFVESHNHPLIIDECTHMMSSQRCISSVQAIDVELASNSGIAPRNSYELMAKQVGCRESVGYIKLDQ
ncbi:protein FAR1-RELATED SEQUENCE 5-like [Cornus florida]|uniref:protein FAR1-RELATED SEQUENCE 5-like n=1 Tax=Cornus florida TaxID=4283 RepID=UPI0028A0D69A|nr:protein FAR1-RELATED SEQUENCE 5-like [Cornus florida]